MDFPFEGPMPIASTINDSVATPLSSTDKKELSDQAESLKNRGKNCVTYNDKIKALKLFKLALQYAITADDKMLISQIKRELGKLYGWKTENTAGAIKYDKQVKYMAAYCENNPNVLSDKASEADDDLKDMSYMYTNLNIQTMHRAEVTDSIPTHQGLTEEKIDFSIKSPYIFPDLTCVQFGIDVSGAYQRYDNNKVAAVFISPDSVAAHQDMPYPIKTLAGVSYPLLTMLKGYNVDTKVNLEVPTFDGLFGTWSYWAEDLLPKIPISVGVQSTSVNAFVYSNYSYFDATKNYTAGVEPKTHKTTRYTVGTSLPTMKMTTHGKAEEDYKESVFIVPILNYERAWLTSKNKSIYSFMEEPTDSLQIKQWQALQGDPGIVNGYTASIGGRVNFQKYGYNWYTRKLEQSDGAHRPTLTGSWGGTDDPTTDRGIFAYDPHMPFQQFLNLGFDWDIALLGTSFSVPISFGLGRQDLWNRVGRKSPAYYVNGTLGIKYDRLSILLSGSHSTDGIYFTGNVFNINMGFDFW